MAGHLHREPLNPNGEDWGELGVIQEEILEGVRFQLDRMGDRMRGHLSAEAQRLLDRELHAVEAQVRSLTCKAARRVQALVGRS